MATEPKRSILPIKPNGIVLSVPVVEGILGDALRVVEIEITRLHHKLRENRPLTSEEARILQGHIRCLVELSKESRERGKREADDLAGMDDNQLADLMLTILLTKLSPPQVLELVQKLLATKADPVAQTPQKP